MFAVSFVRNFFFRLIRVYHRLSLLVTSGLRRLFHARIILFVFMDSFSENHTEAPSHRILKKQTVEIFFAWRCRVFWFCRLNFPKLLLSRKNAIDVILRNKLHLRRYLWKCYPKVLFNVLSRFGKVSRQS